MPYGPYPHHPMPYPVWPALNTQESAVPDAEVECLGSCPPDPIATSELEEPMPPTPKTKKNKFGPKREKNYS
ncbi:hypothetical protein BAE44_0002392 [Dichanthelium oligosanthes]|uniref:Uncharacterized protein n=1 Tax=Dichanthelium oligosanthes TaxID=888268 RepID=A0A1E5WHG0_9POAL|nr:hypothetical protein BAE44_0002392 [Dichanthelium oligosanthes]